MCGIVAAAAQREVSEVLLEGLRRLEYRGYDSAGLATLTDNIIDEKKWCEQGFYGKSGENDIPPTQPLQPLKPLHYYYYYLRIYVKHSVLFKLLKRNALSFNHKF